MTGFLLERLWWSTMDFYIWCVAIRCYRFDRNPKLVCIPIPSHLFSSLVFRRKDLCEAKHDLRVRKMCSKSTLCSHYATLWGGGVKCSVLIMFSYALLSLCCRVKCTMLCSHYAMLYSHYASILCFALTMLCFTLTTLAYYTLLSLC